MSANLMKKLYKMQQNQEGTDCCFSFDGATKDSSKKTEKRLIYAHKLILSAASSVFSTMLSEKWVKDENIAIKDGSYNAFNALIKAIYTGRFELEDDEELLEVYFLAHLYQVHDVLELISAYMLKMIKYDPHLIVPFLNLACLYDNSQLMEACMSQVKLNAKEVLEAETFTTASTEVVKLIFSLDPLNIESDTDLIVALEKYLQVHPEARPELDDAIQHIRFLTMGDDEIMECQFLDTKIKERLVTLNNNLDYPSNNMPNFSKNRNRRSEYKILSALPSNIVLRLYELFNDRHCFFCKVAHSCFSCSKVLAVYKPFTYLSKIFQNNYSHTCLERYTNDHIKAILQTFNKLAIDEMYNKTFEDFLYLV